MADLGTRLLAVCDALAGLIGTNWNPTAPNAVTRSYVERAQLNQVAGRQVWVMPAAARYVERADRKAWLKEVKISVRCLEYYADPGQPLAAWINQRVEFVGQQLHDNLILFDPSAWLLGTFYTPEDQLPEITDIANIDLILNSKAFYAEVEHTFRGIET